MSLLAWMELDLRRVIACSMLTVQDIYWLVELYMKPTLLKTISCPFSLCQTNYAPDFEGFSLKNWSQRKAQKLRTSIQNGQIDQILGHISIMLQIVVDPLLLVLFLPFLLFSLGQHLI